MVRCILSIIISVAIVTVGAIYENLFIHNAFDNFHTMLYNVEEKLQNENATTEDIYAVQKYWLSKKRILHAFIPHTEIKEIDLWISEAIIYTKNKNYKEAEGKIEVCLELSEQIPNNFKIKFENLF